MVEFTVHPIHDGSFAGRVEHVVSGKAAHFKDLSAFERFVNEALSEPGEEPEPGREHFL